MYTAVRTRALTAAASLAAILIMPWGVASASPVVPLEAPGTDASAPDGSRLVSVTEKGPRKYEALVYSAAMDRNVIVDVYTPADNSEPRPALYALDGVNGTDMLPFLADKNVNVISPHSTLDGYWADWKSPDPKLGVNKWETFGIKELPPIIDAAFGTNGVNGVVGMSRTGTAALRLATAAPGLFKAVASYSGCANTSDPLGQAFVRVTFTKYGDGGNPDNMWGPPGDPTWTANDPILRLDGLRGTTLYISNGGGLPGEHDRPDGFQIQGNIGKLANQMAAGGAIEATTNACTHLLKAGLDSLGIPATYDFPITGTHSWGYWQDQFRRSWPVLAAGMGIN